MAPFPNGATCAPHQPFESKVRSLKPVPRTGQFCSTR
jgi:hypothetical protein